MDTPTSNNIPSYLCHLLGITIHPLDTLTLTLTNSTAAPQAQEQVRERLADEERARRREAFLKTRKAERKLCLVYGPGDSSSSSGGTESFLFICFDCLDCLDCLLDCLLA